MQDEIAQHYHMKSVVKIGLCGIVVSAISCDDYRESVSPIVATDLPETTLAGETISFTIYHVVFNGCGRYFRQETKIDGKTITVKIYGKYPNRGICPDNIPTLETRYGFNPATKGVYYFKFFADNYNGDEYLLDTLVVR